MHLPTRMENRRSLHSCPGEKDRVYKASLFYTDKLKEAIQKNLLAPGHPLLQFIQRPSTTSPSSSTSVAHQTDPPWASALVHLSKVRPPYLKGKTHGSFREPTVLHAAEETMRTKCKI